MPAVFTPKVVTANALRDGDAVWLTRDGRWSPLMSEADLITDADQADLRLSQAKARASEIAGPYLAEARMGHAGPEPVHFREAFRTRGPSNYPHGKQVKV